MPFTIQSRIYSETWNRGEEIDETVLWLELLTESEILSVARLRDLVKEANELLAIFTTSQLTAKGISCRRAG